MTEHTEKEDRSARRPVDLDIKIGERIALLRRQAGLSRQVLAGRCGLSGQQLQKYERGTNRVPASRLFVLADTLSVPVQHLLSSLDGAATLLPQDNAKSLPSAEARLLRAAQHLDEASLHHLAALAETLSRRAA